MIVTGDPGQSALAVDEPSGLNHILSLICDTSLALVHRFNGHQIVRNDLVAKIEALYVQSERTRAARRRLSRRRLAKLDTRFPAFGPNTGGQSHPCAGPQGLGGGCREEDGE